MAQVEEVEEIEFTRQEIKKHNDSKSCWVIMDDQVYDLTKFLYEHPGGEEVILERAGGDGTDCFDNIGHSQEAKERRQVFKIGVLKESERIVKEKPVQKEESEKKVVQKSDSYLLPVTVILVAFLVYFYLL